MITDIAKRLILNRSQRNSRSMTILIAVSGIILVTAAVVIAFGVLSGYQRVYRDAVLNFNAHLIVYHEAGLSQMDQQEIEQFLRSTGETLVYSRYHFYESLAPTNAGFRPVIFKGVDFDKIAQLYPIQFNWEEESATPRIVVGQSWRGLKSEMSRMKFRFLKLRDAEGQFQTKHEELNVSGTFVSGYYDFDSRFVLMPLEDLFQIFSLSEMVSGYEIRLSDIGRVQILKRQLEERFAGQFHVMSWDELNSSLFEALALDRTVVFAVCLMMIMIACLNVFGFNFLFFIQRKREFLILSSLGLSLRRLRHVLTMISLAIGGLSAVVGIALGLTGLWFLTLGRGIPLDPKVYYVDRIPVHWPWDWFVALLVVDVLLCLITSRLAGWTVIKRYMTANLEA